MQSSFNMRLVELAQLVNHDAFDCWDESVHPDVDECRLPDLPHVNMFCMKDTMAYPCWLTDYDIACRVSQPTAGRKVKDMARKSNNNVLQPLI
jgi:hypothetical protein